MIAEYGWFEKLALQLVLPVRLVDSWTRYTDLSGSPVVLDYQNIHHQNGTWLGLGDAQLFAHSGLSIGRLLFGGRLGLSLPLGNVTPNPYRLEELGKAHQHLQLGTGTFDPLLGLDASWQFSRWALTAFGFLHAPLYAGPQGYQAGARLLGGAVASSTPGGATPSARLGLSVVHELAERWGGRVPEEDGNQGRTDLYLNVGATFPFGEDWSASVEVNARIWGAVTGAQLNLPIVLQLSVGRLLHLEASTHEQFVAATTGDVVDAVSAGEEVALSPEPGKWTIFDFWAPWCEACKELDSRLRSLAAERSDVAVRRVNIVDFDSPIARKELPGVELLPHLRLLGPDGTAVLEASARRAPCSRRSPTSSGSNSPHGPATRCRGP